MYIYLNAYIYHDAPPRVEGTFTCSLVERKLETCDETYHQRVILQYYLGVILQYYVYIQIVLYVDINMPHLPE